MTKIEEPLTTTEEYINSGVHIGTKFKNAYSKSYIIKSRADGLKILDTKKTEEKLKSLISLLSGYKPQDIVIMGRRENAKIALTKFGELVGCDVFTGRYLPGKLTNVALENYKEYKVVVVCDPLTDKNILREAFEQGIVTVGFCDSNNVPQMLDLIVPINNKGKKSLGLAFMLLAKHYLANRGILKLSEFSYSLEDFSGEQ